LRLNGGQNATAAELALLLATAKPTELRRGPEALRLAQAASSSVNDTNVRYLNALAAAWIETGDPAAAARTLWKSVRLARMRRDKKAEQRLITRIARLTR